MSNNSSIAYKKKLLTELITNQLPDVPLDKKLSYKDLLRITKYINTSLCTDKNCCIWNGYVTNSNNGTGKGLYINFFFRNKKVALHRLLYENFIGILDENEYIKFSCENKGKCCNIKHFIKHKYVISNIKIEPLIDNNINPENIEINFD
jgi:hypothetical protein